MSDPRQTTTSADPDRPGTRAFVGRDRELTELRTGLDDALNGRGRVFLIVGEPGIGKTRLAEELAATASAGGAQVLWGRCWEGGGAPAFWPWIQILRALIRDRDPHALAHHLGGGASCIASLVPDLRQRVAGIPAGSQASTIESEQARFPLFDATTTFLQRVAVDQPLVILLDDLHAADDPSLLLLQFAARELRSARVLLIGTYREVEVRRQPECARLLSDVARNGHRLPLSGWPEPDVAHFIQRTFVIAPPPAVITTLHRTTDGNPFFVDEVVRWLLAEGRDLTLADATAERLRIPAGIREVTHERLRPLSATCQRVVSIAAVIGRDFDLLTLQRVSELPAPDVLDILSEAITAGIVTKLPGITTRYSFTHMLIRQTVYDDLPAAQRLSLHQRIGEVLETLSATDPDAHVAELAHHFLQAAPAGDLTKAITYGERAGRRAADLLAYEDAAAHYTRTLDALVLGAPDPQREFELLLALGNAQARAWHTSEARETFLRAAERARYANASDSFARAVLALGGIGHGLPRGGVVDPVLVAALEEALVRLAEHDHPLRARILARLAAELYFSDAEERRAALSRQAVEMARRCGQSAALAYAVNARHFALWDSPDVDERLSLANEGIQLAESADDRELALQAHTWRLLDVIEMGVGGGEWERELDACSRLADELRQPRYLSNTIMLRAMRALWLGRFAESDALGQEIGALAERVRDDTALGSVGFQAYVAKRALGQYEVAEMIARRGVEQMPHVPIIRCALALIQIDQGHDAEARAEYGRLAADDFVDLVRTNALLPMLPWLAELCAHFGDRHAAALLYERLFRFGSRFISFGPRHCFGPGFHALGLLATTLERWDEAAKHFEDARARSLAAGGRPAVAATEYAYARMLVDAGPALRAANSREHARDLLQHAHDTARELGMTPLAERAQALADVARLEPSSAQQREPITRALASGDASALHDAEPSGASTRGRVLSFPAKHRGRAITAAPPQHSPATTGATTAECSFRLEGEFWTVGEGMAPLRLKDTKGLRYIAHLLRHPSREFHALDLIAHKPDSVTPAAAQIDQLSDEQRQQLGLRAGNLGDLGALLDPQARAAYKRQLQSLRAELEEATRFNDLGRITSTQNEIEFLTRELARAVGLHGRTRSGPSATERARVNVTRAIKAVLKRIADGDSALGRHLSTTIKTGTFCSYTPDPRWPKSWRL
ncbi:MAG: AAA family ATPase [Deltaproteobacteria bacterium]|nr:AAA family ATPase [Deltaproteobacteria bacterium]MBI3386548.1 AAA family ATPase [Deltaproteobacteria bacterium]